jgi:hypothetical protein
MTGLGVKRKNNEPRNESPYSWGIYYRSNHWTVV